MTPFTSFVAVEELHVTVAGSPVTIAVPVEPPEACGMKASLAVVWPLTVLHPRRSCPRHSQPPLPSKALQGTPGWNAEPRKSPAAGRHARQAAEKLAPPLVGLEQQVQKDGTNGSLTLDTLRVVDYMVDVMIYLRDTSAETPAALQQLGFIAAAESKTVPCSSGASTPPRRNLAQLDALRVTPVTG